VDVCENQQFMLLPSGSPEAELCEVRVTHQEVQIEGIPSDNGRL